MSLSAPSQLDGFHLPGCRITTRQRHQKDPKTAMNAMMHCHRSRRARLEHQALALVFERWDERSAQRIEVMWEGKIKRQTRIYLGAVVVDHPQLDKFAGGSCT